MTGGPRYREFTTSWFGAFVHAVHAVCAAALAVAVPVALYVAAWAAIQWGAVALLVPVAVACLAFVALDAALNSTTGCWARGAMTAVVVGTIVGAGGVLMSRLVLPSR